MFGFFAVCPDGSRPVNCFANPCDVSSGCYNIPMASCRYDIISFFTSVLKRYENKQLNCKVSHLALIMLSIWFQSNSFHDLKANASLIIFLFKNKISSFVALTFTRWIIRMLCSFFQAILLWRVFPTLVCRVLWSDQLLLSTLS